MATFYVSSGSGNDSDNGESPATAKKTLGSVLGLGMADGDTVEILDEETYFESSILIDIPNLTITHTASQLGRPKVNGLGQTRMWNHNTSGTTFHNIEMYNATTVIRKATANATQFHLTGCFIHGFNWIADDYIQGAASNKTSIDSCILYTRGTGAPAAIPVASNCIVKNSLVTGSGQYGLFAPADSSATSTNTETVFSTFIRRGASTTPIIRPAKAINCIVSGTGDGIASDDHTYNLVIAENANFRNEADSGDGSAGTGDLEDQDPLFIDGNPSLTGSDTGLKSYFQLQATSPAINYGTPYLLTTRDLTGNVRPTEGGSGGSAGNPDMGCFEYVAWAPYKDEGDPHFSADFTINLYRNLPSNYRHRPETPPATSAVPYQVPFFLGPKGPISLRKEKAYLASEGDPSVMTGSG